MPSLTPKKIDGHTYYYARYCQRVDGKPKIVRTVYLGRIEDLVATTEAGRQPPQPSPIRASPAASTCSWLPSTVSPPPPASCSCRLVSPDGAHPPAPRRP